MEGSRVWDQTDSSLDSGAAHLLALCPYPHWTPIYCLEDGRLSEGLNEMWTKGLST